MVSRKTKLNILSDEGTSLSDIKKLDNALASYFKKKGINSSNNSRYYYDIIGRVTEGENIDTIVENIEKGNFGFESEAFEKSKQIQLRRLKNTIEPPKVSDSTERCPGCGSKRNAYVPVQIRRADEPPTKFYSCYDCPKKWKRG